MWSGKDFQGEEAGLQGKGKVQDFAGASAIDH